MSLLEFRCLLRTSQVVLVVKNPPAKARALRYAGILAWRIPRSEEPGGLQPMGSQRVGHNRSTAQQDLLHTVSQA